MLNINVEPVDAIEIIETTNETTVNQYLAYGFLGFIIILFITMCILLFLGIRLQVKFDNAVLPSLEKIEEKNNEVKEKVKVEEKSLFETKDKVDLYSSWDGTEETARSKDIGDDNEVIVNPFAKK